MPKKNNPFTKTAIAKMSDAQLEALGTAIHAEMQLRVTTVAFYKQVNSVIQTLSHRQLNTLMDVVYKEEDRRADLDSQLHAAHLVEQSEAKQDVDPMDFLRSSSGRLVQMVNSGVGRELLKTMAERVAYWAEKI